MLLNPVFPLTMEFVYHGLAEALVAGAVVGAAICWICRLFKGTER